MSYRAYTARRIAKSIGEPTRAGDVPTNGPAYPCPSCSSRMLRAATIETDGELVSISEEYRCSSCGHETTIAQGSQPVPIGDGDVDA